MLERALKSLVDQDYPNLEVIVSDNASTDNTPEVCARMQKHYPFIRYHRNPLRVPTFENFNKVLSLTSGYYFMWAADDDLWEPNFVSILVDYLESNSRLVLVAAEAQYMLHDGAKLPFFPEGKALYKASSHSRLRRLLQIVLRNYGNLIYGLCRKEALFTKDGRTILDVCKFTNEIPIFVYLAAQGGIQVCNKVLLYKRTSLPTYLQAAREYGFTPVLDQPGTCYINRRSAAGIQETTLYNRDSLAKLSRLLRPAKGFLRLCRYAVDVFFYQAYAFADIRRAIWVIDTSFIIKLLLLIAFTMQFIVHFLKLTILWQLQDVFSKRIRV